MTTTRKLPAIDDGGMPKHFDDPTLSDRAKEIAARVRKTHETWERLSQWGWAVTNKHPDTLGPKEGIAFKAYRELRVKLAWPLWNTAMTDEAIDGQRFAIQATYQRVKSLVPEAFQKDS